MVFQVFGCTQSSHDSKLSDNEMLLETARSIVEAIVSDDKDAFNSLLSDDALHMDDTALGFEYMHQILEGDILEIRDTGGGSSEIFDPEGYEKVLLGGFDVVTSTGTYELDFEQVMSSIKNEDPKGVRFIKLFRTDDFESEHMHRSSTSYKRNGVFNPKWNEAI